MSFRDATRILPAPRHITLKLQLKLLNVAAMYSVDSVIYTGDDKSNEIHHKQVNLQEQVLLNSRKEGRCIQMFQM